MKKTPPCTCWTQDEVAFDQIEGWVANPRRRYPSFIPCGQGAMACSNCSPTLAYPDHDRNSLTIFDPWSDGLNACLQFFGFTHQLYFRKFRMTDRIHSTLLLSSHVLSATASAALRTQAAALPPPKSYSNCGQHWPRWLSP